MEKNVSRAVTGSRKWHYSCERASRRTYKRGKKGEAKRRRNREGLSRESDISVDSIAIDSSHFWTYLIPTRSRGESLMSPIPGIAIKYLVCYINLNYKSILESNAY